MTNEHLTELLHRSITAALKAGKEILKIYETDDFDVEMKSDNSPLTKADKVAHQTIINELSNPLNSLNPLNSIPILSEEGKNIPYEERKDWKLYWLIDPLDGTKEFIKRNGEFTVNIALIENNQPVLGVIYAPVYKAEGKGQKAKSISGKREESINSLISQFTQFGNFSGTLYFSTKELGTFKANYSDKEIYIKKLSITQSSNHPISSSVVDNYDDELEMNNKATSKLSNLVAVGSRSHSSEEEKTKLEELGVTETISVGSSLKFCMVAEGQAQVYYRHGPTMEWDVAAGYSIAKEAGAKITGLQFNKENLLNGTFLIQADLEN